MPGRRRARRGRRAGFTVASLLSALGAAVAFEGLRLGSFLLFTCGTMLVGCYMSAQGFYRFAAADSAPEAIRPRAISLVQAGGLAAALSGPVMVQVEYRIREQDRPQFLRTLLMLERARDRVREEPLFMLAATAGVAYVMGLMARR